MLHSYFPLNYFDINGIIRQNPTLSVSTKASKEYDSSRNSNNVLNSETGVKCWHSGDASKSSIEISFNTNYLHITQYSLQSPDVPECSAVGHFPKQWKLYGKDGSNWNELSDITESGLNSELKIQVFNISKEKQGIYNKFKFESDSVDYFGDSSSYSFVIQAVDFWGSLCSSKTNCLIDINKNSCSNQFIILNLNIIPLFIYIYY